MNKYGLIGKELSYSFSPYIHNIFFQVCGVEGEYNLHPAGEEKLGELLHKLKDEGYSGVNVTIPYKESVIQYLDKISKEAERIGAVNTILFKDGLMLGYNTDYHGVDMTFKVNNIDMKDKKVMVFGTGGAAKSCCELLSDLNASEILQISRQYRDNWKFKVDVYENINKYEDFDVLINATPLGMKPDIDETPIDQVKIGRREFVLDMIYNPIRTRFLINSEDKGLKHDNGLCMLVHQAMKAQEIWNGITIDENKKSEIYNRCKRKNNEKRNIVLIGMPGSGKTTVAKIISDSLKRKLIECDNLIQEREGKSIPEIFKSGETSFRDIEEKIIREVSMEENQIISTGGGCILREENIKRLKSNGLIIYLKRDIDKIYDSIHSNTDRPLVREKNDLEELYSRRSEIYEQSADIVIENNGSIEKAVERIIRYID